MFFSSLSFIIVCFIFISCVHSGEYLDAISKHSGEDGMMVEAWDDVEIGRIVEAREEWENVSTLQVQSEVGVLKNKNVYIILTFNYFTSYLFDTEH